MNGRGSKNEYNVPLRRTDATSFFFALKKANGNDTLQPGQDWTGWALISSTTVVGWVRDGRPVIASFLRALMLPIFF